MDGYCDMMLEILCYNFLTRYESTCFMALEASYMLTFLIISYLKDKIL